MAAMTRAATLRLRPTQLFAIAAATGKLAPTGDLRTELLLFAAMAVVPQIGGHTLYNWSLRFVSAPVVSVSLVGEPIGSSLLAWILLAETPSLVVAVGGLLALAGIFLTAYSSSAITAPAGRVPAQEK